MIGPEGNDVFCFRELFPETKLGVGRKGGPRKIGWACAARSPKPYLSPKRLKNNTLSVGAAYIYIAQIKVYLLSPPPST